MTTICVIGGTGLLGAALVPALEKLDHNVVCLSRTLSDEKHYQVDYLSASAVEISLDKLKPSFIINLAALTNVDECERNPHDAYLSNVRVVEILSSWIKKNQDSHLIQISTDQIYDGSGPHDENSVRILNYYGLSKYSGELAASNIPSTILRTNFFGRSKSKNRESFSDWIFRSLTNKDKIEAFIDVQFSPLSINNLVHYITRVVNQPVTGTFNLGSREGFSKADFIYFFAKSLNLNSENVSSIVMKEKKLIANRPTDMRMDCSKFELAYNCSMPTLEDQIVSITGDYIYEAR